MSDRLAFCVILGMMSTFTAEVLSGSTPFVFFSPLGWIMVFPLYTLHILVLSAIIVRYGRFNIYTLFFAGMLFGLYEAYITKVLWTGWGHVLDPTGTIAWAETAVLVLFFHPWFAFIIPLAIAELTMTGSRKIIDSLPGPLGRWLNEHPMRMIVVLSLFVGATQVATASSMIMAILSIFMDVALLIVVVLVFRNRYGPGGSIEHYLPEKKELPMLIALLVLLYVVLGLAILPQNIPDIERQAIIWAIYAAVIPLFIFSLWRSKRKDMIQIRSTVFPKERSGPSIPCWRALDRGGVLNNRPSPVPYDHSPFLDRGDRPRTFHIGRRDTVEKSIKLSEMRRSLGRSTFIIYVL